MLHAHAIRVLAASWIATAVTACMGGGPGARALDATTTHQAESASTVFTIVLENHDYTEIVGSDNAPYINQLIQQYGLATNYKDSGHHPSLPNYLYMVSGKTQYPGILDLNPDWWPYFPARADNLGMQMTNAGIAWRSYQEDMGDPCTLDSHGNFAPRHDPFLYFDDIQNDHSGLCAKTNVDYAEFPADLASGAYRYMWITPNLLNDGHDPQSDPVTGLRQSDAWLARELPAILQSDVYRRGGVVFITWDEAEGRNGDSGDQIPMIVLSPLLPSPGFQSAHAYSHASYLATVEDLFALPRLGDAQAADPMTEFLAR